MKNSLSRPFCCSRIFPVPLTLTRTTRSFRRTMAAIASRSHHESSLDQSVCQLAQSHWTDHKLPPLSTHCIWATDTDGLFSMLKAVRSIPHGLFALRLGSFLPSNALGTHCPPAASPNKSLCRRPGSLSHPAEMVPICSSSGPSRQDACPRAQTAADGLPFASLLRKC